MKSFAKAMKPDLVDAVETLAATIQHSSCWQTWHEAQDAMEHDPEMAPMFGRYRELAQRRQDGWSGKQRVPYNELLELDELEQKLTQHELFRRRDEATANLSDFLVEVNTLLSARIQVDFAAAVAPQRGCCG